MGLSSGPGWGDSSLRPLLSLECPSPVSPLTCPCLEHEALSQCGPPAGTDPSGPGALNPSLPRSKTRVLWAAPACHGCCGGGCLPKRPVVRTSRLSDARPRFMLRTQGLERCCPHPAGQQGPRGTHGGDVAGMELGRLLQEGQAGVGVHHVLHKWTRTRPEVHHPPRGPAYTCPPCSLDTAGHRAAPVESVQTRGSVESRPIGTVQEHVARRARPAGHTKAAITAFHM